VIAGATSILSIDRQAHTGVSHDVNVWAVHDLA
jgi:hypothetical protein